MIEIVSYFSYRSSDLPCIKLHADRIDDVLRNDYLRAAYGILKDAYPYRAMIPSFDTLVRRMYHHTGATYNGVNDTFEAYYDSMMLYLMVWSALDVRGRV